MGFDEGILWERLSSHDSLLLDRSRLESRFHSNSDSTIDELAKLTWVVTPANAGVQNILK